MALLCLLSFFAGAIAMGILVDALVNGEDECPPETNPLWRGCQEHDELMREEKR